MKRLLLAALLGWLAWQGWGRFFVSEESRVKAVVSGAARAVENGDLLKLADALAPDFSGERGLDKASVVGMIRGLRGQYADLSIVFSGLTAAVEPGDGKARAEFAVQVLARPQGGGELSEVHAGRYRLLLRKDPDGWRVIRAESPTLGSG